MHRPGGSGSVDRDELLKRADGFARGRWTEFFENASEFEAQRRSTTVLRSETEDQVGRGRRQELTGAALAPMTLDTLAQLQERRHQERVMEIPPEVVEFVPDRFFELDRALFTKCLQSAPSGCAPGPGGCSNEMLRMCFDNGEVFQLLFRTAEDCAFVSMPKNVRKASVSATMTAF